MLFIRQAAHCAYATVFELARAFSLLWLCEERRPRSDNSRSLTAQKEKRREQH